MELWEKIGWAALLVMMLVILLPRAKQMAKESPKGSGDDWRGFIIPITLVVAFVIFLIMLVGGG